MEAYQFWALYFGLSSTPWIFTMVLNEVAQFVHHYGIKFLFHLNDRLISHQDPVVLLEHVQFVLILASCLV